MTLRTAIIHEWLAEYAGSERVVEQMLELWPEAQLHALVDVLPPEQRGWLSGRTVRTSFIQRLPFAARRFRGYLPLFPLAVEQFDLNAYDLVVSSHHCVAKGALVRADQVHVSYVHSPMRYAWDLQHQYLAGRGVKAWLRRQLARPVLHRLRQWDVLSANRVDAFVANSRCVAERIWRCWRREAEVVYPPVDVAAFTPGTAPREDWYLHAGRLVSYKRADVVVAAFARMPSKRLLVVGDGPELAGLRRVAPANVTFLGRLPFEQLRDHLRRCRALIFAAEEDFGILPVEAMACGTPVLAYGRGGATETVIPELSGLHFPSQEPAAVMQAIDRFEQDGAGFDATRIRAHALQFAPEHFRTQFAAVVDRAIDARGRR